MAMIKRFTAILLLLVICWGCHKGTEPVGGCNVNHVCTALFAMIGIHFVDKNGNAVTVKSFSAINQRTQMTVLPVRTADALLRPGYYNITDDSKIKLFSAGGDDVLISATDSVTNQIKTTMFKIASGDCGCHVTKLSGSDQLTFD